MSGKDQKAEASGKDPKVKSEEGGATSTDDPREESSGDELSTKYKDLIKKYNLLVERLKRSDARRDQLKTELSDLEGVKNEESNRALELRVNLESLEAQNADLLEELGAANRLIETGLEEEINDIMATGGGPIPSKVPTFSGDSSADGNAAALWLSNLESLATGQKWTDNQTLSNAILALSGDAGEWRWSEQHDNADWFKDLNLFKENFKKRFCKAKTEVEAVKILSGLNQKQSESVRTFYDRCNNAVWLSSDDDFTKAKTLWKNGEAERDISREEKAYTRHLSWTVRCNFVNGLRPSIRAIIESKFSDLDSKDKLIKAAVEAENAQSVSSNRIMELEAQIASMQGFSSRGGFSGRGRGRGATRGSGGGGRGGANASAGQAQPRQQREKGPNDPPHRVEVALRNTWMLCYKCGQWGKHKSNECKLKPHQIAVLVRQDNQPPPPGPVVDPWFDKALETWTPPRGSYPLVPVNTSMPSGSGDQSKN